MNVRDAANMAALYVPGDASEAMRIAYCDDDAACFVAIGEESDEEDVIKYADVDLNTSLFYKLVAVAKLLDVPVHIYVQNSTCKL